MAESSTNGRDAIEHLDEHTVLIAGGGPVGLMVATVLAHYGVRSVILERNNSTTKWPKMDLTNGRSMELLARLGLAEEVRNLGVPETTPSNVYMTTGLHNSKPITSWEYPSVRELRAQFRDDNNGTSPSEPWQRISQELFEKLLKSRCDENDLVDCRFGWKVDACKETEDFVSIDVTHTETKQKKRIQAKFLVGCDGASSRTRRDLEIPLDGGPLPGYTLLVHFKSRDLGKLFKFGRFWHLFIFNDSGLRAAAICQDDKDTFTTHLLLPLEADHESIDSHDAIYQALGGVGAPYKIAVDEILVRSTYRHSIAVARTYRSDLGKVFLAGDSAHQNIPTGGYGMNTGIGDAYDIAWKLAAVIKQNAGPALLDSYEEERRPVALSSIERSGVHMQAHIAMSEILGGNAALVEEDSAEGRRLQQSIDQHYKMHNGENIDLGVEMDYRHKSGVYPHPSQQDGEAPPWDPSRYVPSTFPGSRAPHVFLQDGSSIFDHYGPLWTLVQFVDVGNEGAPRSLLASAGDAGMQLKHVVLRGEDHARKLWEYPLVLVRPDGHVVWRGRQAPDEAMAKQIVKIATGWEKQTRSDSKKEPLSTKFTATMKADSQVHEYKLEQMGAMQL